MQAYIFTTNFQNRVWIASENTFDKCLKALTNNKFHCTYAKNNVL